MALNLALLLALPLPSCRHGSQQAQEVLSAIHAARHKYYMRARMEASVLQQAVAALPAHPSAPLRGGSAATGAAAAATGPTAAAAGMQVRWRDAACRNIETGIGWNYYLLGSCCCAFCHHEGEMCCCEHVAVLGAPLLLPPSCSSAYSVASKQAVLRN